MTSALLSAAEAALALNDAVEEETGEASGSLNGRVVTHWSYKLFIAGTVVGVVVAVACYAIGMHAIAIFGAFLAVTNGFAAFYIKKFAVLKTLEDYTGKLAKKVNDLKEVNQDLEKVNGGLQQIPSDWRAEIQKGKREIERKTRQLKDVSEKLQATERKLQKLAGITCEIQKRTGELSEAAVKFSKENQLFGEKVERLEEGVKKVEKYNVRLADLIMETDVNTDAYEKLNQQFSGQLQMQSDLFGLMKDLYIKAQKRMKDLEAQVDELGVVIPKAVKAAEEAKQVRLEMKQLRQEYEQVVNKLEATVHTVERYQKYKEGYKELKELKKSEKWPEIERLLKL
ncbi:hypothetical protein [Waddlia chondrophila]|uniref:Uncharacterized protein n=1 Tax=Waddlia chondrophila (strain ATCC VR-1470 / WSU 86-1044) TaxID=716544 RepID=D6YUE8_WADCW|nr:hypothetical protein [Waddlia chondrophila]ADI37759.1 hypothetical protein wcw_0387 [Waddlia chondrophila WSU 86-1044]